MARMEIHLAVARQGAMRHVQDQHRSFACPDLVARIKGSEQFGVPDPSVSHDQEPPGLFVHAARCPTRGFEHQRQFIIRHDTTAEGARTVTRVEHRVQVEFAAHGHGLIRPVRIIHASDRVSG